MIPINYEGSLLNDFRTGTSTPSYSYRIQDDRIVGMVDGLEALKQAIDLVLHTERFAHSIFTWQYGVEFAGLLGMPAPLVYARLSTRIEEALLADDRIEAVSDFVFTQKKGKVFATFQVKSRFGVVVYMGEVI